MNAFRFPLHKGSYEADEHYKDREYAVGAAIVIAAWCGALFAGLLGFVMAVRCGPIYALVPACIVLGVAGVIALAVALVKGLSDL